MTVAPLAACGSGEDSTTDVAPARTLSAAELEKATVTTADLDGYEVQRALSATFASRRTAEPSECTPLAQALGGSSGYAATARVARSVSPNAKGHGVQLTLSSHSAEDAVHVMDALKKSAEKCEAFKDVMADFDYEAVDVRSGTDYGDDAVSLELTQLLPGDTVRVPYAVVAVRQGATIAMFTTFVRPTAGGKSSAAEPEPVIEAQLKKLS
ncbi:hypothetical protein [Streptomyces cylindrosporus]|uniref:Lipoprotein n=1 Tax=Streptomyces cylindrosporus TaxID=2927583 RepID=A0ABS9YJ84_9ACTN|nr:hypothetical protein [Streptomyces cylindrosporus]MCI3277311.1 hypothetical protein [Streptomyces cylindrosporus]